MVLRLRGVRKEMKEIFKAIFEPYRSDDELDFTLLCLGFGILTLLILGVFDG